MFYHQVQNIRCTTNPSNRIRVALIRLTLNIGVSAFFDHFGLHPDSEEPFFLIAL